MPDPVVPAAVAKSWKTSVGGIALIVSSIALLVHAFTAGDWAAVQARLPEVLTGLGGLGGGAGLLAARDNGVSSEQAGAK